MREACGTLKLPPIWLNLAHVNLLQKNYETAIRLYQTYIDTFGEDSDENIHLYLANAYFLSGNLPVCFFSMVRVVVNFFFVILNGMLGM
jgi:hypothetical protein